MKGEDNAASRAARLRFAVYAGLCVSVVMLVAAVVVSGTLGPLGGDGVNGTEGGAVARADAPARVVRVAADAAVPVELTDRVRAETRAAVAFVATVWPGAWSRLVEVTVVADGRALARESPGLGLAAGQLDGVAALAVVPLGGAGGGGVSPREPAGVLVVNAKVYGQLSELGARVVLRHEVTHLASAAATPPDMPVWLVEGFADAVGHSESGSDVARLAPELAADVSAGWLPVGLPTDADFAGADSRVARAYQQAWLACKMIIDEVGMGGLVRLYRAVGTGPGADGPARLEKALTDVLGTTYPGFLADWRTYLATGLAGAG